MLESRALSSLPGPSALAAPDLVVQDRLVNGAPGLVAFYEGGPAVIALRSEKDVITRIDVIVNPEKLRRTGLTSR